jgi:hypothetical protein
LVARDEHFREIHDEGDPFPLADVLGDFQEEAGQDRGKGEEIFGRPLLMEIGVFDVIEDFEPFEEPLLHLCRAESKAA